MSTQTLEQRLRARGISRREFVKYCATLASMLALPETSACTMAETLEASTAPSLIWMSFQECTGCTESLTRSYAPSLEELIFELVSLDYHETLMAASGDAAESARAAAMRDNWGKYLLAVDGSVATKDDGLYSTVGGISNLAALKEALPGAALVISIGTCAAFGGVPAAQPNPTGAVPVSKILQEVAPDKPLVNVPGCPPLPGAITAVIAHWLSFGQLPELDEHRRPLSFYGETIHDRCARRPFYRRGQYAQGFDDEGAKAGQCLYQLGCKGPTTYNACASVKWNDGTSFPVESGHGCLGCSEPGFWDAGSFYAPLSDRARGRATGAGAGGGLIMLGRARRDTTTKKPAV